MSAFGLAGLNKLPGGKYNVEQSGFATYDVSFSGVLIGPIPFIQGDIAPEYPNVVLMSLSIIETGTQCNHIQVDLHYEGKDIESTITGISADISIDFTTSQEPIESHPDFVTDIGGTPLAPKHGAYFDATTGEFLGFPVVDPDEPAQLPSRFAGLRSYLMPQEVATSNSIEYDYPTPEQIESIGRVVEPDVFLPALPGNRSWVNNGIRVQNIGNVYFRTQKVLMLSGPRNWIPEVYGSL